MFYLFVCADDTSSTVCGQPTTHLRVPYLIPCNNCSAPPLFIQHPDNHPIVQSQCTPISTIYKPPRSIGGAVVCVSVGFCSASTDPPPPTVGFHSTSTDLPPPAVGSRSTPTDLPPPTAGPRSMPTDLLPPAAGSHPAMNVAADPRSTSTDPSPPAMEIPAPTNL